MQQPVRRTILIASPGPFGDRLPGVLPDVRSLSSYFQTPKGGSWHKDEITLLIDPSRQRVLNMIAGVDADFLRVYFCGHGMAEFTHDGFGGLTDTRWPCLPGDEFVCDLELINKKVPRQEIICDCCRTRPRDRISGIPETIEEVPFSEEEFWLARRIFDQHIANSPNGITLFHSTADGEPARDSDKGGQFTIALLENALNWQTTASDKTASLAELFRKVADQLKRAYYPQYPEILIQDGDMCVPFALNTPWPLYGKDRFPPRYRHRSLEPIQHSNSNPVRVLLTIGIVLAGTWLLTEGLNSSGK
ncbi:MAG: caspase family protein [Puia sp.]|nr:caspase family protein [Puia sp.]